MAAAGSPALTHGREAVRLRALRQSLRRQVQPPGAHADTLRRQELPVLQVPQELRPQVVPQQTPGVGLHRRRESGLEAPANNGTCTVHTTIVRPNLSLSIHLRGRYVHVTLSNLLVTVC